MAQATKVCLDSSMDSDLAARLARDFDLAHLPPSFHDDPYPTYRALQEHAPVKRLPDGVFFLSRWDDLNEVYRDNARFRSDKKVEFLPKFGRTPLYEHHTTSLIFNDPPLHGRVRRLIAGALTPRAIGAMAPSLEALVERLLDRLGPESDLIEDFAAAIPIEVIGNLLDVPPHERGPLRAWSLAILGALEPVLTPDQVATGNTAVSEFLAYLETLVDRRRAKPGDPAVDVLTRLLAGEGSERLSAPELLHNCIFLLNAGHETTTNLIGNALVLLHDHPAERDRVLADPALVRTAVEEVLRFESSNQLGNRWASEAVTLAGVAMPAGALLTLCIGAANRDPAQFPDPDRFDAGRTPNRHLSFAAGPHQCVGMSLARLEGTAAIAGFLRRFPGYALAGRPVRGGRVRFRGYARIPCWPRGAPDT